EVLGSNSLYSGRLALTQDTRDSAFAATEGYYLEVGYEQVFGTYNYPRVNVDFRKYYLLNERPDGSGRHVLGLSWQVGMSGKETPLFENYFAGGYSTLRGFRFRSAAPQNGGIYVGGEFSFLGSAEYMFPITADDMLKGVVFCDYGTIEEKIEFNQEDFRVAVGAGLRIAIPAMGPAPIALDFAVPIAREQTDRIQNFSFFVGFGR
ncbi:MAG: outer membrane protein assembly factor, partial [Planctomycetales bacterium]|nr:outer membrane protein assembly factor [Planctomycetales bacterium]